jgi:AraC family transcriptional regulator
MNTGQFDQRLSAYRPEIHQRVHSHHEPHISVILAGSVREEGNGREFLACSGMFALRPSGFRHQVRFGPDGALILSAAVDAETLNHCETRQSGWGYAPEILLRAVMGADDVDGILLDIAAYQVRPRPQRPARWLTRARDSMIEEGTPIAALARDAGVHRVHFSRAFTRAFGAPPSAYRRRMAALRAVAAAIDGREAADSAYACGFADQSHMARVLKRTTGLSFGRLCELRTKVTSVQD